MAVIPSSQHLETTNGTKTHFTSCGNAKGPLIVLLHGLGGSTETFTPILPSLPLETHHIVSVDFEGLGKTPLSSSTVKLSIKRYVSDLEQLVASLQSPTDPILLVGHSLGSIVSLHYAASHPEVLGLFLLGPGRSVAKIPAARQRMLDMGAKTRAEGISAAVNAAAFSNFPPRDARPTAPEMIEKVTTAVGKSDPEGYARTCEAIAGEDHEDPDYSNIKCSVVIIAGDMDIISPVARSEGLKEEIGGQTEVIVVKSGHQMILEDPEPTTAALQKWIKMLQ